MITIDDLRKMPTLCVGQAANLKLDNNVYRVWVSRCTPDDGETYPVQVEQRNAFVNRWDDVTADWAGRILHVAGYGRVQIPAGFDE